MRRLVFPLAVIGGRLPRYETADSVEICKRAKAIGDGVIGRERDYVLALRSLVAEAKRRGLTADWLAAKPASPQYSGW